MREALIDSFAVAYGVTPEPLPPESIDLAALDALTKQYSEDAWRLGHLSAFSYEIRHRFSFGELEFMMEVSNGIVQTARIYSDAMDAEWIKEMEIAFTGLPFASTELSRAVPESSQYPLDRAEVAEYLRKTIR
jgi:lipoate-protein ligase A